MTGQRHLVQNLFELDTKTIDILDSALSYLVFFDDGLGIGVTVYAGV